MYPLLSKANQSFQAGDIGTALDHYKTCLKRFHAIGNAPNSLVAYCEHRIHECNTLLSSTVKHAYKVINKEIRDLPVTLPSESPNQEDSALNKVCLGFCILLMESEKDVTLLTLSNLLQQIDVEDHIYVLFNGFEDKALKVHIEKHSGITCWQSPANLGVATGRNYLYKYILDNEPNITHIVTLDNDVLLPNDLNTNIKNDVISLYNQNNIGVMGAVILDFKKEQTRNHIKNNFLQFKGYLGADCYNLFSDDIHDYLKSNQKILNQLLWHIGMHHDYRRVYIEREDLFPNSQSKEKFKPFLAHSDEAATLLKKEYFEVSNVPGCLQVFSVDHLREIGLLEDRFSPYFFEDVDFCIRSIRADKKNVISTRLVLMHGTDSRHHDRKVGDNKYQHLVNEYRARYILFRRLEEPNAIAMLIKQARKISTDGTGLELEIKKNKAALEGLMKGVAQYQDNTALTDRRLLEQEITGLDIDSVFSKPQSKKNKDSQQVNFWETLPSKNEPLPRVYFQRLKKFRNLYKDEDCLIICNGPSLKKSRLGLFAGMPTFAVNSTFVLQDQLGFKPTFYTVEDNHVVTDNLAQILSFNSESKFFPDKYREFIGDNEGIFYLPANWDCYFKSKVSYENPEFSNDIARTIYTGQTVTYLNLQIAYFMGFKRVFIVGLDFSYSIPKNARIDHNSIDHDEDDPNHFHSSYFGKGKQWHFPKLDSCMTSYSIAREMFEREGREIIDLTIGGKLNVFKKACFSDVCNFSKNIPEIKEGLSITQYVLDCAATYAVRDKLRFNVIHVTKTFEAVYNLDIQIMVFDNDQLFRHTIANVVENKLLDADVKYLAYPNANIIISATDMAFFSRLPFCAWIDTTLNSSYLEISPNIAHIGPNEYAYLVLKNNLDATYIEKLLLNISDSDAVLLLSAHGLFVKV